MAIKGSQGFYSTIAKAARSGGADEQLKLDREQLAVQKSIDRTLKNLKSGGLVRSLSIDEVF